MGRSPIGSKAMTNAKRPSDTGTPRPPRPNARRRRRSRTVAVPACSSNGAPAGGGNAVWREGDPRRFAVIYVDPPWRFRPWSRSTGLDRAADMHYGTMSLPAIMAMDIPAAEDCALFLWATAPMLPQALESHCGMGLHLQIAMRMGEGSGRHRLLVSQPARAFVARHTRRHPGARAGNAVSVDGSSAGWRTQ